MLVDKRAEMGESNPFKFVNGAFFCDLKCQILNSSVHTKRSTSARTLTPIFLTLKQAKPVVLEAAAIPPLNPYNKIHTCAFARRSSERPF